MGIVFVLLLGEIDLSVGYVSAVAGVTTAQLTLPDNSHVFAAGPTLVIALLVGLAIGVLQGLIITKVGIPSFVVTLAGLLGWNGVVLLLIGDRGTVIIQNSFFVGFANDFLPSATAWILAIVGIALYAVMLFWQRLQRVRHGLATAPDSILALRVLVLAVAVLAVVYVCDQDRGIPYVLLVLSGLYILWTYVLTRTRFGRHVYAVGGNAEAARRAGINVDNIKIACFGICSMMAALGGIVLASRLRSVDTGAGGGSILLYSIAAAVIGGTSLFGGRGHIKSAVLGALVIASIDNGLGLLGLSAGTKFVITAGVLLLAVTVDSVARKGRESAGRA
jgi:D-xylose transport system permease protein